MGSISCRPEGKYKKLAHPKPPPTWHEHVMYDPCPTRGLGAARERRTPRAQKRRKGHWPIRTTFLILGLLYIWMGW